MPKSKNRRKNSRSQRRVAEKPLKNKSKKSFPDRRVTLDQQLGWIKSSVLLQEFIEPYKGFIKTKKEFENLLTIAVTAWNTMLFREEERELRIQELVDRFPADMRDDAWTIMTDMMERKQRLFSQYERIIDGFEVVDTGTGWHLSVMSTVMMA